MANISNKKIISNIGWAYGERILAQVISLCVSIVLARLLDPTHYGIIAIVTVFISFLDAFVTGGFGSALIQKEDADDLDFNTICCFSIVFALILYVGLYFSAPFIASFYGMPQLQNVTKVMGFRVVISAINSVQHAYVQKKMIFRKFFFATLGGTLISALVGITMAVTGFGVWALVAQYLTNSLIDTLVLGFTIPWKPQIEFSLDRLKSMMGFGMKMLGATLVNTLQDNIRSLVVGKVFTSEDLAYYNQGKKYPATLMNNLVGSVQKVMFPTFSESQNNRVQIKEMIRKSIRFSSFVLVPIVIGIIAVADTFILLFLTDKWAPAIPYMRILSLIYLTRTMNSIFQSGLLAIGKSGANMFHEVVGSVLSLLLICVGAFALRSVLFIAWSYVIVMIIGTVIFAFFINKYYEYRYIEIIDDFVPYLLASAVMGIAVVAIGQIHINRFLLLVIQIVVGIVTYLGIAKITKMKELSVVIDMIKSLILKIQRKRGKRIDV